MWIRTAMKSDLKQISRLLTDTWHHTYDDLYGIDKVDEITRSWHSAETLSERIDLPRSEFIVADDGTAIHGVAFATADETGRTVTLHQLYVAPVHQGTGAGSQLLQEIIDGFPEAKTIRLEVEERNDKAVDFYMRRGFSMTGRTENCGRGDSGIPALIFERPL